MIRGKIMRFLAGAMCSVMLVTSESMSGLAYAASVPEEMIVEQESLEGEVYSEFPIDETEEEMTGEEDTVGEENSVESDEEDTAEEDTAWQEVNSEEESILGEMAPVEEDIVETEIFSEEAETNALIEEDILIEADEQAEDSELIMVESAIENAYQFGGAPDVLEKSSIPADSASSDEEDAAVIAYLYQEMMKKNPLIDLSSYQIISIDKLRDLVGAVLNEHPDLYFVANSYSYAFSPDGTKVSALKCTYLDGFDDAAFEDAVNTALATIDGVTDDVQKAIILHDYLAVNCEYDYENYLANKLPSSSHSAYGVFVNRAAVCQGYALAYKYLLNKAGIECYMVTSDSMNHAWNLVKLNGEYYQVDVTWDDPTWDMVGRVTHTNMLRSDTAFLKATGHKDWSVTSGSKVVNYEATDTTYDNAFWLESTSPLILINGEWYFAVYNDVEYNCNIQKRTLTDTAGTIICQLGYWPVWGDDSRLWSSAYTGLSLINGRLYYNDKANIYSIKPDGTDNKVEFTADTTNGYIYGSAYCQGKMYYSLHQDPRLTAKEEVLTADIAFGTGGGTMIEATDLEILDENGEPVTEVSMIVGEEKKLGIKLLPEGAVTQEIVSWSSSNSAVLSVQNGILTARKASGDTPVVITAQIGNNIQKTCSVVVKELSQEDIGNLPNVRCGNVLISSTGIGAVDQKADTVWDVNIDKDASLFLSYMGEAENTFLYYSLNGQMIYDSEEQKIQNGKLYDKITDAIEADAEFQVAVVTENADQQQLVEGIYTIHFHVCNSELAIADTLKTILSADDVELVVNKLPDTREVKDIEWISSDEEIIGIGNKTEKGVMLKIGKKPGTVQVTAKVEDHKGKYVYAVCNVVVSKAIPAPSVKSSEGGKVFVEEENGSTSSYWVIDNGGKVTLSVEGVSDVEIYYTLDGSNPTEKSNRYVAPIAITKATTIKAFAKKAGLENSDIVEEEFKIGTSKLVISQNSLALESGEEKEIAITDVPTGVDKADVAWSSSNPAVATVELRTKSGQQADEEYLMIAAHKAGKSRITASVTDYAGRTVTAECMVKVLRKVSEPIFTPNDVSGNTMIDEEGIKWIIVDQDATIEINPVDGEKSDDVIYYTTDGKEPTTSSKKYTGPIKITKKSTIKAIAANTDCINSDVVAMHYIPYDSSMTLSKTSVSMAVGKKQEISIKKWSTDLTGEKPAVKWTSDNEKIATVETDEEHIYICAVGSGKTQIIASYTDYLGNPKEVVCNVTVTGKLEITPAIIVTEEETATLEIKKNQTGVLNEEITWTSDDTSAVTVSYNKETGKVDVTAKRMTDTSKPIVAVVTAVAGGKDGTDTVDVIACCEVTVVPQSFTVTFVGWNGKTAKAEQVYRNQNATQPLDATMNTAVPKGWVFKGWNEPETTWMNVTTDITITPKYERLNYTITYETGVKGTNPSDNPTSYTVDLIDVSGNSSGNFLALKDADSTDAAYVFAGWYKDSSYTGSPIVEIPKGSTGNLILYAKWIPKNDGMWVVEIPDQTYTGKAVKPEVKVYDGTTPLTLGVDYTVQYKNNTKANIWATDAEKAKKPTIIVKGKGNYTGSASVEFKILPKNISDSTQEDLFTADDLYMAYTGNVLNPAPVLKRNGKKLKNKTEYGIKEIRQVIVKADGTEEDGSTVTECKEVGKYKIIIEGKGNYTGTRSIFLTITNSILMSKVSIGKITDIEWTGKAVDSSQIAPKITYRRTTTLIEGTDYIITYDKNAVDIGSYEVKFTGIGDYAGEVIKTFKIKGKAIKASNIKISGMQNRDYNGAPQTQELSVSYGSGKNAVSMVEGRDYTLTYLNNMNAGKKATVVIQGIGGYSGTVKKTFTIKAYSLKTGYDKDEVRVALAQVGPVYHEKGGAKPEVVVYYGERELTEGTDYTLKYKNNGKVAKAGDKKPPTVTVTGKGNFSGSVNLTFSIVPQDISLCSITANDVMTNAVSTKNPDGLTGAGKYKSTPVLTDSNGKKLAAGTDYKKQYVYTDENGNVLGNKDKIAAGSILTVTVTGTGSYQGEISVSYRVLSAKKSVASAKVSIKPEVKKNYSGEPVMISKEDLIVKIGGVELQSSDYTIASYSNNLKKGTATVTIQGIGEYGGTKTIKFKIQPKLVSWKEVIANALR